MANGDLASAQGLPVVPSTAQRSLGYDEINLTRDLVTTWGVKPATALPIARGGTGGTTAAAAQVALGVDAGYVHRHGGSSISLIWAGGRVASLIGGSASIPGFLTTNDLTLVAAERDELRALVAELTERVAALERSA